MTEYKLQTLFKNDVSYNLIILILCILVGRYVQYHWQRRRLYKMAAQRKGPLTLPFIGNLLYFGGSASDLYNNVIRLSKEFESPVRLWFGQQLYFGIWKPKDLEAILTSPHALNKTDLYKFTEAIVGDGMVKATVPKWRRHKKIIMPTMNPKILEGYLEVFSEQAEILVQQLRKHAGKGIFDIHNDVSRCGLDIVCETVMGIRINAQTTESEFMQWVNTLQVMIVKRMFGVLYYHDFIFNFTSMAKQQRDVAKKLNEFARAVIAEKKADYQKKLKETRNRNEEPCKEGLPQKKHFLQLLIELSEENQLTDEELLDEVKTMMIAGSETTATTETFVFIVLGMFPNIQQKVYEEVLDVVGTSRSVEHTDLGKLQYLEMVIKETMRLFSVGHLVSRNIEQDIKLESCTIPRGCSVMMFLTAAHRDPDMWPNPLKFDPDRFLPEEIAKRHPYSYVPFIGGLRMCIGPRYGMMVMKVIIATVIRKYRISTDYTSVEDIKLKADLILQPQNGYRVSIDLRG